MQKRSLTISGHKTSIALEPEFWTALEYIAKGKDIGLVELIIQIDENRLTNNLSSGLRIFALQYFFTLKKTSKEKTPIEN